MAVAAVSSYHRLWTCSGNAREASVVESFASCLAAPLRPAAELGCTMAKEKGEGSSQCLSSPPHPWEENPLPSGLPWSTQAIFLRSQAERQREAVWLHAPTHTSSKTSVSLGNRFWEAHGFDCSYTRKCLFSRHNHVLLVCCDRYIVSIKKKGIYSLRIQSVFYILDTCYSIHADSCSVTTLKKTPNWQYYFCYECNKSTVTSHPGSLKATIMHLNNIRYSVIGTEAPQACHLGQITLKPKLFARKRHITWNFLPLNTVFILWPRARAWTPKRWILENSLDATYWAWNGTLDFCSRSNEQALAHLIVRGSASEPPPQQDALPFEHSWEYLRCWNCTSRLSFKIKHL